MDQSLPDGPIPAFSSPINSVLVVDDDPDIRTVAELALDLAGSWSVTAVDSGEAALAFVQANHPDLVLLDVMMPGLDGLQTLQALKQDPDLASIPVIFLTAKVMPSEVDRYLSLGAIGTVAKPFDPVSLPESIRAIVNSFRLGEVIE